MRKVCNYQYLFILILLIIGCEEPEIENFSENLIDIRIFQNGRLISDVDNKVYANNLNELEVLIGVDKRINYQSIKLNINNNNLLINGDSLTPSKERPEFNKNKLYDSKYVKVGSSINNNVIRVILNSKNKDFIKDTTLNFLPATISIDSINYDDIKADGKSYIPIYITTEGVHEDDTLKLQLTNGTFVISKNNILEYPVNQNINADGEIEQFKILLKAPVDNTDIKLDVATKQARIIRSTQFTLESFSLAERISWEINPDITYQADSNSIYVMKLKIDNTKVPKEIELKFVNDHFYFLDNIKSSISYNFEKIGQEKLFYYKAGTRPGKVFLQITDKSSVQSISIEHPDLEPSYPENIFFATDVISIDSLNPAAIPFKLELSKSNGVVSELPGLALHVKRGKSGARENLGSFNDVKKQRNAILNQLLFSGNFKLNPNHGLNRGDTIYLEAQVPMKDDKVSSLVEMYVK